MWSKDVSLNKAHLCFPHVHVSSDLTELSHRMSLGGTQYALQVSNSVRHGPSHLLSLGSCFWALIKGGSESFTNLSHTGTELVSLEEQDEDNLVLIIALMKAHNEGSNCGLNDSIKLHHAITNGNNHVRARANVHVYMYK